MEVRGSSCIAIASNQAAASAVGKDFSNRDYCIGIIKTKTTYLSSAYISSINGNPVLGLVVPVRNAKGEMLGFVYGSLNLGELRGYLWDLQQGQNSKVELLDRYGVMFLNTEEIIDKLGVLTSEEEEEVAKIEEGIAGGKLSGNFRDEDNFVGYRSNGSITLIYEKTATNLLALIKSLNSVVFYSLLVSIFLIIIFVYIFIGRVTRRISQLGKITQEIAGGKFNVKFSENELQGKDETAVLSRSFNDMAGKLNG
jgi:methyl-accepting chemotaxis protein